jgi:uncharacterized membrane protein
MWNERRRSNRLTTIATAVAAAALTAGAAYLFDPQSGGRRRARAVEKVQRGTHQARGFIGKAGRDARERARGIFESSRSRFRRPPADDRIVEERARAQLGRLTAHPGAIEISCADGYLRVAGDILASEIDAVVRGLARVRGVRRVVNEVRTHDRPGDIPSLQGGANRPRPRAEYLQDNWSPAPRLFAGLTGAAMTVGGGTRGSLPGAALALAGAALVVRSISNRPLAKTFGMRAQPEDGILVQKTIHVYAEPEELYDTWRDLERFPRFMSHVREVRKLGGNRYRWVVDGPAGVPVEWDSEITQDVPARMIAWRTVEGSPVQSSGAVRFEPSAYGGTRVNVRLSYRPPGNVIGHGVAKAFGADPKRQLDDDLMRFKSMLEVGTVRGREGAELRH